MASNMGRTKSAWKDALNSFDSTAQPMAQEAPDLFKKAAYNASELPAFQSARESANNSLAGRQARNGLTGSGIGERQFQSQEAMMAQQRANAQMGQAQVQSGLAGQGLQAGQASAGLWSQAMNAFLQQQLQKELARKAREAGYAESQNAAWGAAAEAIGGTAAKMIPIPGM
jgi:hypothetical protein